jgi:hypothetical protein
MSLEHKAFKFNKEVFNINFKHLLEKYIKASYDLEHDTYDITEAGVKDEITEIDRLKNEIENISEQLTYLTVNAIKQVENKKEIIDLISTSYSDFNNRYDDIQSRYWDEKEFFKKVILELLKMNS